MVMSSPYLQQHEQDYEIFRKIHCDQGSFTAGRRRPRSNSNSTSSSEYPRRSNVEPINNPVANLAIRRSLKARTAQGASTTYRLKMRDTAIKQLWTSLTMPTGDMSKYLME